MQIFSPPSANQPAPLIHIKKPGSPSLLYDILEERGITMAYLHRRTHVSYPVIIKLKKGEHITYPVLKLIADFLEVTPEELAQ